MTAALRRFKAKVERALALFIMAFVIQYIVAPSKKDEVVYWLFVLMPLITVVVLTRSLLLAVFFAVVIGLIVLRVRRMKP